MYPEFVEHITAFVEKETNIRPEHRPLFERMLILKWAIRDAHAAHGKDSEAFLKAINVLEGYHYCMNGLGYSKHYLLAVEEYYDLWQTKRVNPGTYAQRLELAQRHGYNFTAIQPPAHFLG